LANPTKADTHPAAAADHAARAERAVRTQELRRDYGERVALRGVTVELGPGETLAVLGPNGAGKTTLLRVLATLLRPSAGSVSVLDAELPRQAWQARGRIGYVAHRPLLYRDLSVAENLRFHSRLHGLGPAGVARAAELLERAGMSARANERAANLSAGMAQRVAICRAVLHEPELLLLDEPFSHLDPAGAALIDPLIAAEPGRTRVMVTHDIGAGLAGADRVLALSPGGGVTYEGPGGDLSERDARDLYGGRER
jgi:heme ABC exporter ATP-binding subunit CcmA